MEMQETGQVQEFEDRVLHCLECGQSFFWFAREQQVYATRGLSEPRHCPACRYERRAKREAAA